jgi:hypothetical protein
MFHTIPRKALDCTTAPYNLVVQLHYFLTSAQDIGECLLSR